MGDRATALIEDIWCEKIRGCSWQGRQHVSLGHAFYRELNYSRHKDKNNAMAPTLNRLTNNADTSGRITKAFGDGP